MAYKYDLLSNSFRTNGAEAKFEFQDKTWVQTPGFRSIAKRDLPANPFEHRYNVRSGSQATSVMYYFDTSDRKWKYEGIALYGKSQSQAVSDEGLAHQLVQSKLHNRDSIINGLIVDALAQAADVKTNLAVAYAESTKTADMILSAAKRIQQAYRLWRRGRYKDAARLLNLSPKTVHKTWLEYSYGWIPLMSEVKGAAELLAQQHFGKPLRFETMKYRSQSVNPESDNKTSFHGYGGLYDMHTKASCEERWHVRIEFEVTNQHLDAIRQTGITDPLSYVWETIPYSFVFDWFISVGTYLQALSAFQGLSIVRASVGEKRNLSYVQTSKIPPSTWNESLFHASTGGVHEQYGNFRRYIRSIPTINPALIYPPVNTDPFNFRRLVSGLALIRGSAR